MQLIGQKFRPRSRAALQVKRRNMLASPLTRERCRVLSYATGHIALGFAP